MNATSEVVWPVRTPKPKQEPAPYVRPPKPTEASQMQLEENVQRFINILNEPLSKDEAASLGQPSYGSAYIGLYKIFKHFDGHIAILKKNNDELWEDHNKLMADVGKLKK